MNDVVDHSDWHDRKSHLVAPGGRQISFVDSGGDGEVLVLLHGYTDSSRSFSLLEPHLSDYRLIMPDLAGHGSSEQPSDFRVSSFANDIEWLISEVQVEPKAIIGHSLGAMIALAVVSRHSVPLNALVTIAGTLIPGFSRESPLGQRIMTLSDPIDPADPFFEYWHGGFRHVDRFFLTYLSREAATIPVETWHAILAELCEVDLSDAAGKVGVPSLCIHGSKDELFNTGHHLALQKAVPGSRSILMPGYGHNPHWENPATVAFHIRNFLRSLDQRDVAKK